MLIPDDYDAEIRSSFKAVGLDDITIIDSPDDPIPETWVRIVKSNRPEHCLKYDGRLLPGSVAIVVQNDDDREFSMRVRTAAHSLKALIDNRKPEEIPS